MTAKSRRPSALITVRYTDDDVMLVWRRADNTGDVVNLTPDAARTLAESLNRAADEFDSHQQLIDEINSIDPEEGK
ncbi:hypothetical protein MHPYR_490043 [uncultured Mycobacterium sp.]|uniref:Uncharacterized protein n=1 Tax=uncultured Mycobacterium sp. TaxID=171292 RepID=A0A1Y5PK87_9MYCO|nr:hypothetical protein MHPYR_490043 [uncultured Mycobacterium sp.]